MATITRKTTDKHVHIFTTGIKAYQTKSDAKNAIFSCIRTSSPMSTDGTEAVYDASPNMLRRLMHGNGAIHKEMQHGLKALPHFNCQLLVEKENPNMVVGVHMIPNSNYAMADMSQELEMPVPSEAAIVQLHESGEIDILAFPHNLYRHIYTFLQALEGKDKLSTGDQFTVGQTTCIVSQVVGDLVTIRCREKLIMV